MRVSRLIASMAEQRFNKQTAMYGTGGPQEETLRTPRNNSNGAGRTVSNKYTKQRWRFAKF